MPIRISNSNAASYVAARKEFVGSNTLGEYRGRAYVVYSYGYHFPMYVYLDEEWYENSDKYSSTTSTQQNQLRPCHHITMRTTKELNALIETARGLCE